MPRRPKIKFNAQPKRPSRAVTGAQSKAAITSAQIGMREAKKSARENAEKTIKIPSPNGKDRNQLLSDRGISVVRPEIIAATEFIPLVKDDDPSDATFTMTSGDKEFKVDVSNAARLLEMQVVAQTMLFENIREVLTIYAGGDIVGILDQFLTFLNGEYAGEINVGTINNMKRQIKDAIKSAYFVMPTDLSEADLATGRLKKVQEAKKSLESLSQRFNKLDNKYQDLLIEYVARYYLVKHSNNFLREMGLSKIRIKKTFDILSSDPSTLKDSSDTRVKNAREYITQGTAAQGLGLLLPDMKSYIANNLISDLKNAKKANSSRNLMHVIKALSSDMQFKERQTTVDYSKDQIPATVKTEPSLENGQASYETFNVSTFFGTPGSRSNMITGNKSGKNFSNNAYDRVRTIIRGNRTSFKKMIGNSANLSFEKIESDISPLLARCLSDVTLHNNFSVKNSVSDFKVIASNQENTSAQVNFNVGSYCKSALYNKDLDSSQVISNMFMSDQSNNGIVPNKIANSFKIDADNKVLPFEQNFGDLSVGEPYIPGGSYYFDQGLQELSQGNENNVFTDLTTFSNTLDTVINDIFSDFNTMRGFSSRDSDNLLNSQELLDNFNNKIADWLNKYYNKSNPGFNNLFFWLFIEKCTKDQYFLTTFITYLKLMEYRVNPQPETGGTNMNRPVSNAFTNVYKNKPRARNFAAREGEDEQKKHREKVSLRNYCVSHMFLEIMTDLLGQKKNGKGDGLGNDFDLKVKHVRRKVKMYGLGADAIGNKGLMVSTTSDKFFRNPWKTFYDEVINGNCWDDLRHTGAPEENVFEKTIPMLHPYESMLASRAKNNLKRTIGSNTGEGDTNKKNTNGGVGRYQPGFTGGVNDLENNIPLNTNRERTYLGLDSTKDMRGFAHLMYFISVLSKMSVFKVEVFAGEPQLKIKIYRKVIKSGIAALRGNQFDSDNHSRTIFNNIKRITGAVKNDIRENNKSCFNHLLIMKAQAQTMKNQVSEIKSFVKGTGSENDYREILRIFDESGIGRELLSFVSPSMLASNKYSQMKLMTGAKKFPHIPSADVITSKQLKNMMTFFNQKTRGFHAKETLDVLNGRKTVMHVGIPAGMLENLQFEALRETGDNLYEGSNLVMVAIHRKDVLNSRSYVYPKTFVFDMSRFVIDYPENGSVSQTSDQSFLSAQDLLNNSQIHKIDGLGSAFRIPKGKAYHEDSFGIFDFENQPGYTDKFQKDVFHNHLTDHYLKMYYKFLLGLDFDEYVYQLTRDSAIRNGPDQINVDLLNQIITNNESVFPDAFKDVNSARELFKINTGIANTLFFNAEHYSKASLYPNAFDRVFSVLLNERDFIYYTGDITKDKSTKQYGRIVGNQFRTDGQIETINKIRKPLSSITIGEKYHNKTRDKDFPQVYMYYAEISIMRRIETPSF